MSILLERYEIANIEEEKTTAKICSFFVEASKKIAASSKEITVEILPLMGAGKASSSLKKVVRFTREDLSCSAVVVKEVIKTIKEISSEGESIGIDVLFPEKLKTKPIRKDSPIFKLTGSFDGPEDLARNHDKY